MTREPDQPQPPADDRGVFGNLPSERPGVRSPRRDRKGKADPKRVPGKGAKAKPSPSARAHGASAPGRAHRPTRPPPPPRASAAPSPPESAPPESGRGGVEEVAWAGITLAAEAATLGVRLFSRALEAVRERR